MRQYNSSLGIDLKKKLISCFKKKSVCFAFALENFVVLFCLSENTDYTKPYIICGSYCSISLV